MIKETLKVWLLKQDTVQKITELSFKRKNIYIRVHAATNAWIEAEPIPVELFWSGIRVVKAGVQHSSSNQGAASFNKSEKFCFLTKMWIIIYNIHNKA